MNDDQKRELFGDRLPYLEEAARELFGDRLPYLEEAAARFLERGPDLLAVAALRALAEIELHDDIMTSFIRGLRIGMLDGEIAERLLAAYDMTIEALVEHGGATSREKDLIVRDWLRIMLTPNEDQEDINEQAARIEARVDALLAKREEGNG